MAKLFELLAIERSKTAAAAKLIEETIAKFSKEPFFSGHIKTLSMIVDSPENRAIEDANKDMRELPTTVIETLEYLCKFWAEAEDVIYAKNKSNQIANSDLIFRGNVIVENVPVDELLGLESRLEVLRKLCDRMPTLDASKKWIPVDSGRKGEYRVEEPEVTSKTEKNMTAVVLYAATDKHPAQIEKVSKDEVVGTFKRILYSGAATSKQKANLISTMDELLVAVKQARMRANSVEASKEKIGSTLMGILLSELETY